MGWRIALRHVALTIVGALTLLAAAPASADAGLAGRPFSLCFRGGHGTATAMFAAPDRFDCKTPQHRISGRGEFWALSAPLDHLWSPERSLLRYGSVWQKGVTIYVRYADGRIVAIPIDAHAATRHVQIGATLEIALPARAVPVDRLLFHVEGSANISGIVIATRLATRVESTRATLTLAVFYAAFAGLCIALLVYNLALWAALRHGFQRTYCLMLVSLLGYAFTSSGALAWVVPTISNNQRLSCNYVFLGFAAAAALLFARDFFEGRVFAGWLGRVSRIIVVALAGTSVAIALLGPRWSDTLLAANSFAYVAELAIIAPILWRAWRLRSNYLWLFAIAWAAPVALAGLRIAYTFHLVGWHFWIDNSTPVAMMIEALLSSLAIAYRIRILSRERDEAREREIAAHLLANTDPLTDLLNRRAFLADAVGRSGAQTLILIDVDHFKQVNETIGHDGGDDVLRAIARELRRAVRPGALVARLGGEEFGVLTAAEMADDPDRLLAHVRSIRMPFDLTVTVSAGICTGPLATERDWKMLYRNADRALFAAKSAGRDRVRIADPIALAA